MGATTLTVAERVREGSGTVTTVRNGRIDRIEAIDRATRWPLYLASGAEPLFILLLVNSRPGLTAAAIGLVLLAVVHAVVCVALLHAAITAFLGGPRPARLLVVAAVVLAGIGVAAVLAGAADVGPDPESTAGLETTIGALVFCAAPTCAVVPLFSSRRLVVLVGVPALAATLLENVVTGSGSALWGATYFLVVGAEVVSYRFSVWQLGVAWELNRARGAEARLAVAEERLRLTRDLHDVLGRNLALIAVNSQVAAELARRGQSGAVERMLDIHRTAQDSMREAREVVAGSRATDLGSELAGARAVLRSAGITARVIGDGTDLPPAAQTALGWVVREATTNVIRHSEPTLVKIDLELCPADALAVLRIENDGVVRPGSAAGSGTGLAGLTERLAVIGGTLSAGAEPEGRFVVRAQVPLGPDREVAR